MKMILKIARKELQLLFYSPVAWVLLIFFVLQTAMMFSGKYEEFLKRNEFEGGGINYSHSIIVFILGGYGI